MIRYKEKEFENYFIDPNTAIITDDKGKEKPQHVRAKYKVISISGVRMKVHQIMAHTYLGYKPDYIIHHLDENKLNNALSNLVYLTRSEHMHLHTAGIPKTLEHVKNQAAATKGRHRTLEQRKKISISRMGIPPWNKGKHHSEEAKQKNREAHLGKHTSKETKEKQSAKQKGKRWWCLPTGETVKSIEWPGKDWVLGRRIK